MRCIGFGVTVVPVLVDALVRPFLLMWVWSATRSWLSLPLPTGAMSVHATGTDADRVLLVGSGAAISFGTFSHDLGLAGHLARRLTAITGRGTTVDVRAWPGITTDDVIAALSNVETAKYDAVVLTLGGSEALLLKSVGHWRGTLDHLMAALRAQNLTASAFFIGVPGLSAAAELPRAYRSVVEAHIRRINEETAQYCDADGLAVYVGFEPVRPKGEGIGRDQYERWANLIAGPIADGLDRQTHPDVLPVDEDARLASLYQMKVLDAVWEDDEVNQLVETAMRLFGATGAGLNIIDRTRQWAVSTVGRGPVDMPRGDSVCTSTIELSGPLIVADTHDDLRYRGKAWANGKRGVRFYAGHPIESPDGHRIGALCIVDESPHGFSAADRTLLRDLATRVQELLWTKQPA